MTLIFASDSCFHCQLCLFLHGLGCLPFEGCVEIERKSFLLLLICIIMSKIERIRGEREITISMIQTILSGLPCDITVSW